MKKHLNLPKPGTYAKDARVNASKPEKDAGLSAAQTLKRKLMVDRPKRTRARLSNEPDPFRKKHLDARAGVDGTGAKMNGQPLRIKAV